MNWLNQNAGAIQAFATAVLIGVTWRYVRLTRRMATTMEQQMETKKQQMIAAFQPIDGKTARPRSLSDTPLTR